MIGIVILNYNTWEETIDCCKSIILSTKIEFKIYVVDNNSQHKINSMQQNFFRENKINVIFSKVNKGYSAGNNIGIKRAIEDNCQNILISNSDVIICENTIEIMNDYLVNNKHIAIVGPHIYNLNHELQPFYMISKLTAIGKIKNMLLKTKFRYFLQDFKNSFIIENEVLKPKNVFSVSGCCFMISKECINILYPLDENTFLYEEEYIIGSIIEKTKFSICILPNTYVIHAHGASTQGMTKFSYNCFIKSEQYYLKEYLHENLIIRVIILCIRNLLSFYYVNKKGD